MQGATTQALFLGASLMVQGRRWGYICTACGWSGIENHNGPPANNGPTMSDSKRPRIVARINCQPRTRSPTQPQNPLSHEVLAPPH